MAKQATTTITYGVVGDGAQVNDSSQEVNANAPQQWGIDLGVGNTTVLMPNNPPNGAITTVTLRPPPNSTNVKTLKGIAGDTGFPNWTNQTVKVPAVAGQTFIIVSAGVEHLDAWPG